MGGQIKLLHLAGLNPLALGWGETQHLLPPPSERLFLQRRCLTTSKTVKPRIKFSEAEFKFSEFLSNALLHTLNQVGTVFNTDYS